MFRLRCALATRPLRRAVRKLLRGERFGRRPLSTSARDLRALVRDRLGAVRLVVVSNREPYVHVHAGDEIICQVPPGGLVTALDPVMRACGGTWVAHGSGDADQTVVDEHDRVLVPPG